MSIIFSQITIDFMRSVIYDARHLDKNNKVIKHAI